MLAIDADVIWALAPKQSGHRAVRQREIIDGMGAALTSTLAAYQIDTPLRIAHFLAQVAEESDGFCTTEEYASGNAYEGRKDLGNTEPGDGPRYKGRGLIQLTGRANYENIGRQLQLNLVKEPLSVNDPYVYLLVSCVFWQQRDINRFCDADDVLSVTHRVNGGTMGLDVRRAYLTKAKALAAGLASRSAEPPGGGLAVLHRGSEGSAVALLQQRLSALGYPVALDGDFGPATELAVRHFQAAAGLDADGVAGAQTWAALDTPAGKGAAKAQGGGA